MRLPPLRALVVFDAVAESGGFSRAAEQLHLSQSAVSHQIRQLEEFLGERLFLREGRQVRLSEQGERFYEKTAAALRDIERATDELQGRASGKLRLAVYSSFAVRWLIPRLSNLRSRHPELELEMTMLAETPQLSEQLADAFIAINPRQRGYSSDLLYREQLFPVCSPRLWAELRPRLADPQNVQPAELATLPLLAATSIFDRRAEDWRRWFAAVGAQAAMPDRLQHFSHMLLAHEAASHHQGVALSNDYMFDPDDNTLIRLPCHAFDTGDEFHFAFKTRRAGDTAIQQLRGWLRERAAHSSLSRAAGD